MPICVLKTSRENEARFLHQNEVNLRDRETKWPPTIFSACICTGSPTQTKLDLRSPIVDRDYRIHSIKRPTSKKASTRKVGKVNKRPASIKPPHPLPHPEKKLSAQEEY